MDRYNVALIILYDSEQRFLLQHRTKDAKLLPDHWAFFGGGFKEDETPEQALAREAYEELGYTIKSPRLVLEREFKEGNVQGYLYIYIEYFNGDKSELRLQEGQGWGWYKESEIGSLTMIERDRGIVRYVADYLKNGVTTSTA